LRLTLSNASQRLRQRLLDLSRHKKRAILALTDLMTLAVLLWSLTSLRYSSSFWPGSIAANLLYWSGPIVTVATFSYLGLYRHVTRYLGAEGQSRILAGMAISVLIWSLLVFMLGQLGTPRSVILIYGVSGAAVIIGIRHLLAWFLKSSGIVLPKLREGAPVNPVIIYGAGQLGVDLALALYRTSDRDVVGFCDDSPSIWGQYIAGYRVYRPDRLAHVIERMAVKEILLAIPASERNERRLILKELERYPVSVKLLPSLSEIASGRVAVADLRPLEVEDLLGRDPVPPNTELLERVTTGKNIMVTGAGGSVGSELVRQLLRLRPNSIVLLDVSEPALYEIAMEARDIVAALPKDQPRPQIAIVLGSVLDATLIKETIMRSSVHTIYHAAAYKHVPMVEHNAAVGLTNNVMGTEVVADAAIACGVERMVLISTDKAVRPTNVMGASKRLAELILQARAAQQTATIFTMVRFGNVLDSSGSVVRRFRRQIQAGGPVTVTHPEVIRYFMSIPEAAELVLQAGAMAKGGEVFVLDMGEPVKINDLAELMIRLSGLEPRNEENPEGDIEIVHTGLRPGEKLYEELLIGAHTTGTEHSRILRSDEPALAPGELRRELELLRVAISMRDVETIQSVLSRTVEGYKPDADTRAIGHTPAVAWTAQNRTLH